MRPFSVYLHIPFCFHKCPYCDFNTYAVPRMPEDAYVAALLAELDARAATPTFRGRKVQTIYFGGGTPSLLSSPAIDRIITALRSTFETDRDIEISLEANPGGVTAELLSGYRAAGVNRLSFGAQSLNPATLQALGRVHTPAQVEDAVATARQSGFANLSLDLMFGAPEQTLTDLETDIRRAVALNPNHLSTYGLTIEKGTPFFVAFKRGALQVPSEDALADMLELATSLIARLGLHRYEISNYAAPGFEARHNLAYWNGDDYLGLGAGAHSYVRAAEPTEARWGERWSNFAIPDKYMGAAQDCGTADSWRDTLDLRGAVFEFFFLGLRKIAGVSLSDFQGKFGLSAHAVYGEQFRALVGHKLLLMSGDVVRLSPEGLMVADSVIESFADPERLSRAAPSAQTLTETTP